MKNKALLDDLLAQKILEPAAYEALLRDASRRDGRAWISSRLLAAGTGFILAGLVCFFAANWRHLGVLFKLGLPLAGLAACGVGAYYKRLETAAGQAFAFGAAVFIGIFLAVFGQVYQSGAFVYEWFGKWGLLLLPLCAAARNKWLWLFTLYVGAAYWTARCDGGLLGALALSRVFWGVFTGAFLAAWAAAVYVKSGKGFCCWIWMPLSLFTVGHALLALELFRGRVSWEYFIAAAVLAAGWLLWARREKDGVLFGWNALAAAVLAYSLLGYFTNGIGLHLTGGLLFFGAGAATYVFWRLNREED